MPWSLKRYQEARCLHFLTFSCYHRAPLLGTPAARDVFEQTLERTRRWYGFYIGGYVVMPEHVHLLVSEPKRSPLCTAIQMLKQNVARSLSQLVENHPFWQTRYYDFNVWSEEKRIEKLRYMHRNPVKRGLVESPADWLWSSFRHYVSGYEGAVEIESRWTERKEIDDRCHFSAVRLQPKPPPCLCKKRRDKDGAPPVLQSCVERRVSQNQSLLGTRTGGSHGTTEPHQKRTHQEWVPHPCRVLCDRVGQTPQSGRKLAGHADRPLRQDHRHGRRHHPPNPSATPKA